MWHCDPLPQTLLWYETQPPHWKKSGSSSFLCRVASANANCTWLPSEGLIAALKKVNELLDGETCIRRALGSVTLKVLIHTFYSGWQSKGYREYQGLIHLISYTIYTWRVGVKQAWAWIKWHMWEVTSPPNELMQPFPQMRVRSQRACSCVLPLWPHSLQSFLVYSLLARIA